MVGSTLTVTRTLTSPYPNPNRNPHPNFTQVAGGVKSIVGEYRLTPIDAENTKVNTA